MNNTYTAGKNPRGVKEGSPRGVATHLDCDIVVSEFELKSSYYVHF